MGDRRPCSSPDNLQAQTIFLQALQLIKIHHEKVRNPFVVDGMLLLETNTDDSMPPCDAREGAGSRKRYYGSFNEISTPRTRWEDRQTTPYTYRWEYKQRFGRVVITINVGISVNIFSIHVYTATAFCLCWAYLVVVVEHNYWPLVSIRWMSSEHVLAKDEQWHNVLVVTKCFSR